MRYLVILIVGLVLGLELPGCDNFSWLQYFGGPAPQEKKKPGEDAMAEPEEKTTEKDKKTDKDTEPTDPDDKNLDRDLEKPERKPKTERDDPGDLGRGSDGLGGGGGGLGGGGGGNLGGGGGDPGGGGGGLGGGGGDPKDGGTDPGGAGGGAGGGGGDDPGGEPDGKGSDKKPTGPDLAAEKLTGTPSGPKFVLKGKIKNLGKEDYTEGRKYQFEQWKLNKWVTVKPAKPVPTPLQTGKSIDVEETLAAAPAAGTKFRLHLTPKDAKPANDDVTWTSSPAASTDLAVEKLSGSPSGPGKYVLKGTIKNVGKVPYKNGRQYEFAQWKENKWVALSPATAVPELHPNQSKPVEVTVMGVLPPGTKFRLRLTSADTKSANDEMVWTVAAAVGPDLAVLPLSKVKIGTKWYVRGTIRNAGPVPVPAGRSYRLEKLVGPQWMLVKTGPLPMMVANQQVTVQALLGAPMPPVGTKFRLRVVPGDSKPANDMSPMFVLP